MEKRGLFIGRFQPFHNGHLSSIKLCLTYTDELIIAIGSADKSYEFKNPFTAGERLEMIMESIKEELKDEFQKIIIIPIPDLGIHKLWTYNMDLLVPRYSIIFTNDIFTEILFKERKINVINPHLVNRQILSATEIRYRIANDKQWQELVSKQTVSIIKEIDGINRIKSLEKIKAENKHMH